MSENRSWGHAVIPLDDGTRKRDDEALAKKYGVAMPAAVPA